MLLVGNMEKSELPKAANKFQVIVSLVSGDNLNHRVIWVVLLR